MEARVTIQLSEQGQKDALSRGLSAEKQQIIAVPANNGDLKFFNVDNKGALSLNLHYAASAERSYSSNWKDLYFDVYPSPDEILTFLRTREARRAGIEAAEQAEKEEKAAADRKRHDDAYEKFCAMSETDQEAALNSYYPRADIGSCALEAANYPMVAAALQRREIKKETAAQKAKRRKQIPGAPIAERTVAISAEGLCEILVPTSSYEKEWAKRVTAVNPAQSGGYALEGSWLTCGEKTRLAAGDVVAVGSKKWEGSRKRGSYITDYAVYVVTPALLVRRFHADTVAVRATGDLLALTAEERIEQALGASAKAAQEYLDQLSALDRNAFESDEIALIDERIAAWQERKAVTERALQGADPESNIVDIDGAAAAIIAAGYRELAKKHHPDAGGAAETMALLNAAKKQLVEILNAAREVK